MLKNKVPENMKKTTTILSSRSERPLATIMKNFWKGMYESFHFDIGLEQINLLWHDSQYLISACAKIVQKGRDVCEVLFTSHWDLQQREQLVLHMLTY